MTACFQIGLMTLETSKVEWQFVMHFVLSEICVTIAKKKIHRIPKKVRSS